MSMQNGQMPQGLRPQAAPVMVKANPEQFMKNLQMFMANKNLPLDPNPVIDNRPVSLLQLFTVAQQRGGYRNVTSTNQWMGVAQHLGFHPMQVPQAPPHLKSIYEMNLLKFEEVWMMNQKQRMQQNPSMSGGQGPAPNRPIQQGAMGPGQMMQTGQHPSMGLGSSMGQGSPLGQGQAFGQGQQSLGQGFQTPNKPMLPSAGPSAVNGFSGPRSTPAPPGSELGTPTQQHARESMSRGVDPTIGANGEMLLQSPAPSKAGSISLPGGQAEQQNGATSDTGPLIKVERDDIYKFRTRKHEMYGGHDVKILGGIGQEISRVKVDVPHLHELGNVDLHALTRSLQSGIHGEVRLALDTLATVTHEHNAAISLAHSEDLLEALVDCAEEQVDFLAEHTVEVSDEIQLIAYEDVVRSCQIEKLAIREIPEFATQDYHLDRAVDRLIAILIILRNLSFPPFETNENHVLLAEEEVIKFLCIVIRYLGTRAMLLRNNINTLDFMKDLVTLLSNIAGAIQIPGREQALCLLQFLLAFAPSPGPDLSGETMLFTPYDPTLHPYLPAALDAMAKLLARDEPNRTLFRSLFQGDFGVQNPRELLTRSFALAVCTIPDQTRDNGRGVSLPSFVESRKPYIMQGLLAGDILVSLAPGYESGIPKAWLASSNGFAQNLLKLIRMLSIHFDEGSRPLPQRGRPMAQRDVDAIYIVNMGVSMLRKLAEKARDPNDPSTIPPDSLPSTRSLIEALSMRQPEWTREGILQNFMSLATLDD